MNYAEEVLSDAEINAAFMCTNFGNFNITKRRFLAVSILKQLVNYHCGHTITTIMKHLGLIGRTGVVTKLGKRFVAQELNDLMIISG